MGRTSDGRVVFATEARPYVQGVVSPGTHEDRISPETVAALFTRFRKERFLSLRSSYRRAAHDLLEFVLTIDTGGRRQRRPWGRVVGMPAVVTALEDAVDKGSRHGSLGEEDWAQAWLERQHFDFHSPEAGATCSLGSEERGHDAGQDRPWSPSVNDRYFDRNMKSAEPVGCASSRAARLRLT